MSPEPLAAWALDRLVGDPPDRLHPVAWFGSAARRLEGRLYRDSRAAGISFAALAVLPLA
ncbi:MAG: cobalamin biosynthesis protein, partial [Acidimicrobiia bacterium]